jgi:DNA polymerase-4
MPADASRSIIHVDMDAFYASVEVHDEPSYADRPVIVGGLGRRGVVAAANYAARRFGVHSAMPMVRARSLCPDAVYLRPRMARYRAVSSRIFDIFNRVTPLVEGLSLDEAFLDVSGSVRLFGGVRAIAENLRSSIHQDTGLVASIGMAPNKFLAKLASDADKPAGFVEISPEGIHPFLDPMPVGRLWGIGRKTEPLLRRMGILTIGQLRKSDPEALRTVLGNRSGHFLALARGEDERAVQPGRADKSISHEVTFDSDLRDPREMYAEIQRQAEAVMRRLRAKGLAARTVQLKIRDHRFHSVTRSRTLHAASNSTATLYAVARGLLKTWLNEHGNTPVRLLGVGVSGFDDADLEVPALDRALDRIAERFGQDTVTRALALSRRQPGKR